MKKVLVVDDDVDILNVADIMLRQHHFIAKTTNEWQIISKTIKTFIPDLILLDIDLREDGGDLCIKIKKSKVTQHLPVILFSGIMPEDYLKVCNAQGFK